jgi:hypothetical protein
LRKLKTVSGRTGFTGGGLEDGVVALYGSLYGLLPIGWIVITAVFLYNLTVKTGQFEIIKDSIASITDDRRLQALLIAFSFGVFIEGAAGYGIPVTGDQRTPGTQRRKNPIWISDSLTEYRPMSLQEATNWGNEPFSGLRLAGNGELPQRPFLKGICYACEAWDRAIRRWSITGR